MEVKTTLPGRSQLKYHDFNFKQNRPVPGRCQFTFNEPTKRRTNVEFKVVLERAPHEVLKGTFYRRPGAVRVSQNRSIFGKIDAARCTFMVYDQSINLHLVISLNRLHYLFI